MARKQRTIELKDRAEKLTFRITEMAATKLENWTFRAILLLMGSGVQVPKGTDIQQAAQYLAKNGFTQLSSIDPEKAMPLLNEMLACCERVIAPGNYETVTLDTADGYIEDMQTLVKLRMEAFKVNFDFFSNADLSNFLAVGKKKAENGQNTPTVQ